MTIRPTSSGQTPRPGIERAGKSTPTGAPARANDASAPSTPGVTRDDVQISAQARELQQMDAAARGVAGEVPAERMKQVLERLSGGYYDQPQVRDIVLSKLSKDL